jgi:hypothetical protein
MKGFAPLLIYAVIAIAVVGVLAVSGSHLIGIANLSQKSVIVTDYHYLCCVEDASSCTNINVQAFSAGDMWYQCPTFATKCTVIAQSVAVCNQGFNKCGLLSNSFSRTVNQGADVYPGEWVLGAAGSSLRTCETGLGDNGISATAPASASVYPVPGSDHCQFNIDSSIYGTNGQIVAKDTSKAFSYTVPFGRCYAYPFRTYDITITTCSADSDCLATAMYRGTYNGATVGYNVEGTQLTIYGCRQGTTIVSKDVLGYGQSGASNLSTQQVNTGTCDVIKSFSVQCQPNTNMCGTDAVCQDQGNLNFQCIATNKAECQYDWNCGSSVITDIPNKQFKTPVCQAGKCSYTTQKFECVDNLNCPDGYYCNIDHTCKQSTMPKVTCPNQCCKDDARYFDRACGADKPFCCSGSGTCAISEAACTATPGGGLDLGWLIQLWNMIVSFALKAIVALIIAAIIIVLLYFLLPLIGVGGAVAMVSRYWKYMLLAIVIIIIMLFSIPLASMTASVFGGSVV